MQVIQQTAWVTALEPETTVLQWKISIYVTAPTDLIHIKTMYIHSFKHYIIHTDMFESLPAPTL